MNKGLIKNILIILLVSITAFSMVKYLSELKARYSLQDNLAKAQDRIAALDQERQGLLKELEEETKLKEQLQIRNAGLKGYLKASRNKIVRLFQDKARIQASFEDKSAKFSILKAENRALINQHRRIYMENEKFKEKLNSVDELKQAIKELRIKKRKAIEWGIEGNRGFLIKDGRSTTLDKIRIEVVPAKTKE